MSTMPFLLLEFIVNRAPRIKVFEAHITPTGFTIDDDPTTKSAQEVSKALRQLCLTYEDDDGVHPGVLDLGVNLPTRYPQALQGNPRWSFCVAGRQRHLNMVREHDHNRLAVLLIIERALTMFIEGKLECSWAFDQGVSLLDEV